MLALRRWTVLAFIGMTTTWGCGGGSRTLDLGSVAPAPGAITLTVRNDNFQDVNVYAIQDGGFSDHVGMVTGLGTAAFTLSPDLYATGTVRLVATPIGARGVARSGPLLVTPGNTIDFEIAADMRFSTASVR
jgi:hypothetical protein